MQQNRIFGTEIQSIKYILKTVDRLKAHLFFNHFVLRV